MSAEAEAREDRAVLILGESAGLGMALIRRLERSGVVAEAAVAVSDNEASALLREPRWSAVAVVTRDDVLALRLTLLSAHLRRA